MARWRTALGWIAGAIMILSSGMHTVVGWSAVSKQLAAIHAPADFAFGVAAIWHFSGAAMLVLGAIVLAHFARQGSSRPPDRLPVRLIALLYLVYGVCVFVASRFDPFFFSFLVPGAALALAVWP